MWNRTPRWFPNLFKNGRLQKSAKIQPSQQHCERRGVTLAQSAQRVARFRLKFASPLAASRRRSMTKRKTELRPNCETIAIGVGLKGACPVAESRCTPFAAKLGAQTRSCCPIAACRNAPFGAALGAGRKSSSADFKRYPILLLSFVLG